MAACCLVILLVTAVALGSTQIGIGDTAAILARRLLGLPVAETWAPTAETIIMQIRLPRVLTAMIVGGGLAMAGTVFQALLRNPLADPYVIGTAAGASFGAALGIAAPLALPDAGHRGGQLPSWAWASCRCSPSPAASARCCWSTPSPGAADASR